MNGANGSAKGMSSELNGGQYHHVMLISPEGKVEVVGSYQKEDEGESSRIEEAKS